MEHLRIESFSIIDIQQFIMLVLFNIPCRLHEESSTSSSWIADDLPNLRLHKHHHHPDNVARSPELPVCAVYSKLRQQIFIDITHKFSVIEIEFFIIQSSYYLLKNLSILYRKIDFAHETGECGTIRAVKLTDKREHIVLDDMEHLLC